MSEGYYSFAIRPVMHFGPVRGLGLDFSELVKIAEWQTKYADRLYANLTINDPSESGDHDEDDKVFFQIEIWFGSKSGSEVYWDGDGGFTTGRV